MLNNIFIYIFKKWKWKLETRKSSSSCFQKLCIIELEQYFLEMKNEKYEQLSNIHVSKE